MTKPQDPTAASNPQAKGQPATPRKDAAAVGVALPNRPHAGEAAEQTSSPEKPAAEKPAIESSLVGKDGVTARPPAARRAAQAGKDTPTPADMAKAEARPADQPSSIPATGPAKGATAASPATVTETRVVEVRKAGFMPTLLGGVLAAGLGAGATLWALPHLPAGWLPSEDRGADQDAVLAVARDAATETARTQMQAARDDIIQGAVEAAETAATAAGSTAGADAARALLAEVAPADGDTDIEGGAELSVVQEALARQADRLAALDQAVAALAAVPAPAQPVPSPSTAGLDQPEQTPAVDPAVSDALQSALDDLRAQVAAHETRLTELAAQPSFDPAILDQAGSLSERITQMQQDVQVAVQSAQQSLSQTQAEAEEVRQQTQQIARRASVATIAAGLQAALESGGSLQSGIADLQAAGVELPAALSADVPVLPYLQRDFDDAARAGLRASLRDTAAGEDTMGAIGNFLRVQTGARSVDPREGDDPDAVLSRAAVEVRNGDIAAALSEIESLPPAGQQAMSGWTQDARRWLDARTAIADLSRSVK